MALMWRDRNRKAGVKLTKPEVETEDVGYRLMSKKKYEDLFSRGVVKC
jgi:hypothetical protein